MRCVLAIIWDKAGVGEVVYELSEKELTSQLLTSLLNVTPKLTWWERVKYVFYPYFLLDASAYTKAINTPLQAFKSRTQTAHMQRETLRKVLIHKLRARQKPDEDEGYIIPTNPSDLYRTVVGNSKEN